VEKVCFKCFAYGLHLAEDLIYFIDRLKLVFIGKVPMAPDCELKV